MDGPWHTTTWTAHLPLPQRDACRGVIFIVLLGWTMPAAVEALATTWATRSPANKNRKKLISNLDNFYD